MQTFNKVKVIQCITASKIIAGSCSDPIRVKMAEKPQKNVKESCLNQDWWNKERKSFKNRENFQQKWEAANNIISCQTWEVSSQNGRVGISDVYYQELYQSISSGKIQTVLISKGHANKISKIVNLHKKKVLNSRR